MMIQKLLSGGYQKLKNINISSAPLDAELLLSFVLKKPRAWILAHPETKLTSRQQADFDKLIAWRAPGVPLAYLTREKGFYERTFYVDERVLVPRPETEMIIDELKIKNYKLGITTTIVDVGTGSGCIIITAAKELKKYKNLKFFATDISKNALTVARKNAKLHGVAKKITFLHGNLLAPILQNKKFSAPNSQLLILANLPYLTPAEIKILPTIQYDPQLALDGGTDGLGIYRELAEQIKTIHRQYPKMPIALIAEISDTQGEAMKKIFSSPAMPAPAGIQKKNTVTIKKDLAGLDRMAVIKFAFSHLKM